MNRARAILACVLLIACVGATRSKLTLEIQVERSSFDLLDPIAVTVSVANRGATKTSLHFPQTSEYAIDVLDGTTVISTTLASPVPIGVPHTRAFLPGVTALAVYEFNVVSAQHVAPAPGAYTLRVRLLDDSGTAPVERPLRFEPPLSIAALSGIGTHVVTIEGTLGSDRMSLTDTSGIVALTHRLGRDAPIGGVVVVRGALIETPTRTKAFNPVSWGVLNAAQ